MTTRMSSLEQSSKTPTRSGESGSGRLWVGLWLRDKRLQELLPLRATKEGVEQ